MAKFRVLIGKHREGGRTYVAGEVVDSKTDLSKLNSLGSHKFERVEEEGGKPRVEATAPSAPSGAPPSPTPGPASVGPVPGPSTSSPRALPAGSGGGSTKK